MIQKLLFRRALIVCIALSLAGVAQADEAVWVRVHHAAAEVAVAGVSSRLEDYGAFQWGPISTRELAQMKSAGLNVSTLAQPFTLSLGGAQFDPLDQASLAGFPSYRADPRGDFHLVQFQGPIRSDWLASLRSAGMEFVQYIHPFTYVVWADASSLNAARSQANVRWTGDFLPEFRVIPEQRVFGSSTEPAAVLVSRHVDRRELAARMQAIGVEILGATPYLAHFMLLEVAARGDSYMDLGRMAGIYTVQRAIPMMPRGEMSNQSIVHRDFTTSQNTTPGYAAWLAATGYDGSDVIVSIIDGGIRTSHQDLVGQMAPCVSQGSPSSCTTGNDSHGTHVAGAVAGSGASGVADAAGFLRGQGVAPGARMVQQRYSSPGLSYGFGASCTSPDGSYCLSPSGMLVLFKEAQLSGAVLANNSWGSGGIKIGYDLPSQQVDVVTRDANPDLPGAQPVLPVWSIQNGGGTSPGACNNNTLGAPDEAKNLFAVGSTQLIPGSYVGGQVIVPDPSNFFNVSGNSAHGPACDGRVGVHIMAPGCATDSPTANSNTSYSAAFCGTSMASPVVSGALAVFVERYRDLYVNDPSPALMKAAMMAVAVNMEGNQGANGQAITQTPSEYQGFGRVDLDAAVNPPYEVMYFDQETIFTESGQDWSVRLMADDPGEPVRLMLVWTDAHGSGLGGATPAWVNLLDLAVEADSGTFLGNQLGAGGFSQTGGTPDERNNMEAVFLRPDQHKGNTFEVSVTAAQVVADALNPHAPGSPRQDFAMVCYNCSFGEETFTLDLSPVELGVCRPESGSEDSLVAVTVGSLAGYSGMVSLSTDGEPVGINSVLEPGSVPAPGSATWTLSISDTAAAGSAVLTLIGDDDSEQKTAQLSLLVDAFLSAGPGLSEPTDGSSDTTLRPAYAWSALAGAAAYRLQVSTDPGFDTIVIDQVLTETTFDSPTDLASDTEYFWRVAGSNLCDQGAWSEVFSFTTRTLPVAAFSSSAFSLELPQNGSADLSLDISNVGTGSLAWSIELDQIAEVDGSARFAGDFALDNWTLVNSPSAVGGQIASQPGSPAAVLLTGGNAGVAGDTDWQLAIPVQGEIRFSWGYQSADIGNFDRGGFVRNGDFTQLANNASQVPNFSQTHTLAVEAGDLFAFRVSTTDGEFGPGVLAVTDFEFTRSLCAEASNSVDWLTVLPESGSVAAGASQTVSIQVTTDGVGEGQYEGALCVDTNDPSAARVPIPVTLTVTDQVLAPPVIDVQPPVLSLSLAEGGQAIAQLEISNDGEAGLVWQLDSSAAACELPSWLSVAPAEGSTAPDDTSIMAVSFDASALAPGSYEAGICLSSNDPDTPNVLVPVEVEVLEAMLFEDRFEAPPLESLQGAGPG